MDEVAFLESRTYINFFSAISFCRAQAFYKYIIKGVEQHLYITQCLLYTMYYSKLSHTWKNWQQYMHTRVYECMSVCIVSVYVCMYICMYLYMCMYVCMYNNI